MVYYGGKGAVVGRRMMHMGIAALIARKGMGTTINKGIPIKYLWRPIRKRGRVIPNSGRLQPFANQDFFTTEKQYMKLRNFSFGVFKKDWGGVGSRGGRPRGNESERQAAARHLWTNRGSDMNRYNIAGEVGAEKMMDSQKYYYNEAGMEIMFKQLSRDMLKDFIQVIGKTSTWQAAIKGTGRYSPKGDGKFAGTGGGRKGLRYGTSGRGGLPVIGAQSVEEAQFYIMNALYAEGLEQALMGKEVDVNTGIRVAGMAKYVRNPNRDRLDIHKERQKAIHDKTTFYLMEQQRMGAVNWGKKQMEGWQTKINGYDVGETPLEQRFAKHWAEYRQSEEPGTIKNYKELEGFISFLSKKAGKFTVSKAPRGKEAEEIREGRDDIGQFARRLQEEGTYVFSQPLQSDGRMIMVVHEVGDVPTFIPAYIKGANVPLGTALLRHLSGEENAAKVTAKLRYLAERGYGIYNAEHLIITESFASQTFYMETSRYGDITPMVSMVIPKPLAKWTTAWIHEAAHEWWSDSKWDKVFSPDQMSGRGFATWFRMWVERSKKAAYMIDRQAGSEKWRDWIKDTVTPKYMRGEEGGRRPTKEGSGMMMPYDPEPRAWHPPLYARPYVILDNWGVKQQAVAARGGYKRFLEEKKRYGMATAGGWRGKAERFTTGGMILSDW